MILSNRKLKLIITALLLTIFMYFVSIFDVNALNWADYEMESIPNNIGGDKTFAKVGNTTDTNTDIFDYSNLNHIFTASNNFDYFAIPYLGSLNVTRYATGIVATSYLFEVGLFPIVTVQTASGQDQKNIFCSFDMNYIICPNVYGNNKIKIVRIFVRYNKGSAANDSVFGGTMTLYSTWYALYSNLADLNQSASDINNSINSSEVDNNTANSSYSQFGEKANSSMENSPVSNLVTLPITFLQGVTNAISGSCTNVNYIELYGYQLVLPCLNLAERLGSVWVIIDTILSAMLIFSIGKSLVVTFARLSDMDTNIMYEAYSHEKRKDEE